MKNIRLFITIIVVIVIILMGSWLVTRINPRFSTTVALKWVNQAQFAGMYVANEKKYYRNAGLTVTFKEFNFQTNPIDYLKNGIADFVLMSPEEFMIHVNNGEDVYAVAEFFQISPYAFVSLKEKNIKTPADFQYKILGVKGKKTEQELAYLLLLDTFGVEKDTVDIKVLDFEKKEWNNLIDHDADVLDLYRTDQLYYFKKEGIAYNLIQPEQYEVNIGNDILVTKKSFAIQHPNIVRKFVQASVKGWQKAIENPQEAVNDTMLYITDEEYKDMAYQKFILENSIPLIKPSTLTHIGYIDIEKFINLYKEMTEKGFITHEFNIKEFITDEFILQ